MKGQSEEIRIFEAAGAQEEGGRCGNGRDPEYARYYYSEDASQEAVVSGGRPLFYPRHMHMRHWILGWVRLGLAELESPAGTRRLEAGGAFLVPPRVPHSLRLAGHSELLALCLDEEHETFPGLRRFLPDREEREPLARLGDQLVRQTQAGAAPKRPAWGALRGLAERLVAQPEEGLTLAEMARFASISPWHFLRRFRLATGLTPHAFLLNCKIRRLRSLLRGGMTAAEAAAHTGFTDQSHMHKLFKLHHNLTPRQFVLASGRLDDPGALRPISNPR